MNLQITNSTDTANQAQKPETQSAKTTFKANLEPKDKDATRTQGEELASADIHLEESEAPEAVEEAKALGALNKVANLGRRVGSGALKVMGFGGMTLTALTYMFGFKMIALIFALPSAGAFFIAHTLSKQAKQSEKDLDLLADPIKIVERAKNNALGCSLRVKEAHTHLSLFLSISSLYF